MYALCQSQHGGGVLRLRGGGGSHRRLSFYHRFRLRFRFGLHHRLSNFGDSATGLQILHATFGGFQLLLEFGVLHLQGVDGFYNLVQELVNFQLLVALTELNSVESLV